MIFSTVHYTRFTSYKMAVNRRKDVDFQSSVIYFFNFSFKDPFHMSLISLPIVKMSFTLLSQQFKDSKK